MSRSMDVVDVPVDPATTLVALGESATPFSHLG
jgi:hypothetical protein